MGIGNSVCWCFLYQYHLEQMIRCRTTSTSGFVPSMSCALTRILRDACSGASRTAFLVTLSPQATDSTVTMHSLQFAHSVSRLHSGKWVVVSGHQHPSIAEQFGIVSVGDDGTATPAAVVPVAAAEAPRPPMLVGAESLSPLSPVVRNWAKLRA
jgi:hypothetical protein